MAGSDGKMFHVEQFVPQVERVGLLGGLPDKQMAVSKLHKIMALRNSMKLG